MSRPHPLVEAIRAEAVPVVETEHAGGFNAGLREATRIVKAWLARHARGSSVDVNTGSLGVWRDHAWYCESCLELKPCEVGAPLFERAMGDALKPLADFVGVALPRFCERLDQQMGLPPGFFGGVFGGGDASRPALPLSVGPPAEGARETQPSPLVSREPSPVPSMTDAAPAARTDCGPNFTSRAAWREHFDGCPRCQNFDLCLDGFLFHQAATLDESGEAARRARVLGKHLDGAEGRKS